MEREGASLPLVAERSRTAAAFQGASPSKGRVSFRGRLCRTVLAALLAAMMLPLVPASPVVEKAEAFEGTTDYRKVFEGSNVFGEPVVFVDEETARLASTLDESHFERQPDRLDIRLSLGAFMSSKPVSLDHSWEIVFDAVVPDIPVLADYQFVNADVIFGLQRSKDLRNTTTSAWWYHGTCRLGGALRSYICTDILTNTITSGHQTNVTNLDWESRTIRLSYDARTQTGTMTTGSTSVDITNLRSTYGASAYLAFMGDIEWTGRGEVLKPPPSDDMQVFATFKSMSLPNLTPEMSNEPKAFADHDIAVYREDGTTRISSTDSVGQGERVLVVVRTRNANRNAVSGSFEERYPMHLRLSAAQGIKPLIDASHPVTVQVPGLDAVSITDPAQAVESADGVPLELVGYDKDTVVSYWATINAEGNSVDLTHELIEDSFQGRQAASVHLVDDKSLEPAPDGADPSDPNAGAGTAWHYTRLPAANENGWNASPVTVTFYPGDYDIMELSPSGQAPKTLTRTDPTWSQTSDTGGTELAAQARNTSTNAVSVQRAGKVKLDTSAPRIEKGAALAGYTITDVPADAGKATSGVWRLHRTDSSGAAVGARAAAYREFSLAGADGDRQGAPTQSVGTLPNGYYVAEDAAGNLSAPCKVGDQAPPTVKRPDPNGPNPPSPAGPVLEPGNEVPAPTVTDDDEGRKHAVIKEAVTEVIDPAAPPFGGVLDAAKASAMLDYRYAATSTAAPLAISDTLLDAAGNPVASFDTKHAGECLMRRVITDAQGNTTTILLTYRLSNPEASPSPSVTVKPDPDGPDGGSGGEGPLPPTKVVVDPDTGLTHSTVEDTVTVSTNPEPMTPDAMAALMRQRYGIASALPDGVLTYGTVRLFDSSGAEVAEIDRSAPGDWRAELVVTDSAGNTTTIVLTYRVREGSISGDVGGDDGGDGTAGAGNPADGSGSSDSPGRGGNGSSGRFASSIHQLPQTGGILGPCPLHSLFVLIMVLASAYTMMRLRQEAAERDERRRCEAEWEELLREAV